MADFEKKREHAIKFLRDLSPDDGEFIVLTTSTTDAEKSDGVVFCSVGTLQKAALYLRRMVIEESNVN